MFQFGQPRKSRKPKPPTYAPTEDWDRVRRLRAKAQQLPPPPVNDDSRLAKALEQADKPKEDKPAPKPRAVKEQLDEAAQLVAAVAKVPAFKAKLKTFGHEPVVLDHVTPRAQGFAAALLLRAAAGRRVWLVCSDPKAQDQLHAELGVWRATVHYFPRLVRNVAASALPDPDVVAERVSVLARSRQDKEHGAVLLCADSLEEEVPAIRDLEQQQRILHTGDKLDVDALIAELESAGYERVPQVVERGQFARRGGIFDLFGWQADEPLRIELFDDEVESLRVFDVNEQGSVRKLEQASLIVQLTEEGAAPSHVRDYITADDLVVAIECEPNLTCHARITFDGVMNDAGMEDFTTAIHDNPLGIFEAADFVIHEARRRQFEQQVDEWRGQGWRVEIFFHNDAERVRFDELGAAPQAERRLGLLHRGFTIPEAKLAVLTGAEIFGRHQIARRIRGSKLDETQVLRHAREMVRELREHDLVVHAEHGIAKYHGIELRDGKEVMVLRYAEDGKLFVPVAQAHLVTRYMGTGGKAPPLNKLGDPRWARTRKNAERSVEEFAARMLTIAAERQSAQGIEHAPDTKWQAEFEGSFIYRETPDQLRSVDEIKRDMEGTRPMDRLLCADVGFGKTEVAIRAAFKAVMGGKQVAFLAPTTVLVAQHLKTLRERMSEFPVSVEMLCRLTPPDQEREIVRGIKEGSVDIVVGTHRLISKDIQFKNLGLAIVDEEQRFGVKHKERFKEMFRLIDVLTLSATPIPRTLYLALMGMRDMSTIETPPPSRHSVQTSVCAYDDRLIRDAINAELDRGGQVFFLHNRVGDIESVKAKLMGLCPRARIVVGHGQMEEGMLEVTMHKFVSGEADVLVCTTIIESGVDVPNANTIIIDRADRFGLADLYQLRGRVGRGDQRAHAYLLLPRDFVTGGDARKRVNAIKQYTALGSGFKIAMRDLEIRGAGNLLGTEQSGHITAVGFDLYCQMLKQAVNRQQGRRTSRAIDVPMRADFLCQSEQAFHNALPGFIPAFIPGDYMEDAKLRIQAYRAIAEVTTRKEMDELLSMWRDQFGTPPEAVVNLLTCAAIRLVASYHEVTSVEIKDRKLMLTRNNGYVMVQGRFPRLTAEDGEGQLNEALRVLRAM